MALMTSARSAGTVTKWYGAGPRQTKTSPLNVSSTRSASIASRVRTGDSYGLAEAAQRTGISPAELARMCELGIIEPDGAGEFTTGHLRRIGDGRPGGRSRGRLQRRRRDRAQGRPRRD